MPTDRFLLLDNLTDPRVMRGIAGLDLCGRWRRFEFRFERPRDLTVEAAPKVSDEVHAVLFCSILMRVF